MTPEEEEDVDVLQGVPAWILAQALRKKVSTCPMHGSKGQMVNLVDALIVAGAGWLVREGKTHHE